MIWEVGEQKRAVEGVDAAGRPDPGYAAALGLLRAPFGRRALAYACDLVFWGVLQLPLLLGAVPLLIKFATESISTYGFVNHPDFVLGVVTAAISVALSTALVVVQLVLHGRKGLTIGKVVAGIRSVNVRTLERPGIGPVLLRFLVVSAAGIVPVVGLPLMLLTPVLDPDRRGRGWHDRASGVWLVDARRGLNPYDEKRMRIARKAAKAEPLPERSELPSLATRSDSSAAPEYRPGGRISAGVLGVSRTQDGEAQARGAVSAPPPAPPAGSGSQQRLQTAAPPQPTPAPVAPAAAAPARRPVAPPPATAATAGPPPATDAPTPAVPAARAARFALRLDSGDSIPVVGPVLLGRNPDSAVHPGARPVPVPDDSWSLSKTHLLVRPADGGLEVVDWHSTNGSALISGGVERALPPGAPVAAVEGDRIRLGDRVADVIRA